MKSIFPVTICIPTCFGGSSLVQAARSLRKSFGLSTPFIIVSDTTPLNATVKKQLGSLNIRVIENKKSGTQISKIKQMLDMVTTPYVIFTQDDISVSKYTATELGTFLEKYPQLTMFTVKNVPVSPTSCIDYALIAGTKVASEIENEWSDGQNYLRGCGRFLGFRTSHMRKFLIPDGVVNVDAYLYFENKEKGGFFDRCETAEMYYTLPKTISEQTRKSSRYQYCYEEMSHYFSNIEDEFIIPSVIKFRALFITLVKNPLQTLAYVPLLVFTRLIKEKKKETKNAFWKVDLSTK